MDDRVQCHLHEDYGDSHVHWSMSPLIGIAIQCARPMKTLAGRRYFSLAVWVTLNSPLTALQRSLGFRDRYEFSVETALRLQIEQMEHLGVPPGLAQPRTLEKHRDVF